MVDAPLIEDLIRYLAGCAQEQWVYLPGVGWLTVTHYPANMEGRNPRTGEIVHVPAAFVPSFFLDPALGRALNGLPPAVEAFKNEFERFFAARHPDDPSGLESKEAHVVDRFPWADALAAEIRPLLLSNGTADLAGHAQFEIVQKPGREKRARFVPGDEFERRVSART